MAPEAPLIVIKHDSRDFSSSFSRNWSRKPSPELCRSPGRQDSASTAPWVSPVSTQGPSECHPRSLTSHRRCCRSSRPTSTVSMPAASVKAQLTPSFLFYGAFQLPCLDLSLCQMQVVCISCYCCDKSPHIWWLETTQVYYFTDLGVRSLQRVLPG